MKIKFLKAFNGDAILLIFNDNETERRILIDGGIGGTYSSRQGIKRLDGELKKTIDQLRDRGEHIDLLIITHIDDDHIGGILKWFNSDPKAYEMVKRVWFNSGKLIADFFEEPENPELRHMIYTSGSLGTSVRQGVDFGLYIREKGIWERRIILQGDTIEALGLTFKILSPNKGNLEKLLKGWKKEDPNLATTGGANDYAKSLRDHIETDFFVEDVRFPNGSSIAFVLEYKGKSLLFLGDAHPSVVVEGLGRFGFSEMNPIKADLVKVSHHGSKGNTSRQLLKLIDARDFVISTNGRKHHHPDKRLLARLIDEKKNCNIFFNYEERMNLIFSKQDQVDFPNFNATAILDTLTI